MRELRETKRLWSDEDFILTKAVHFLWTLGIVWKAVNEFFVIFWEGDVQGK